jgi:hypothetical protein
VAELLFQLPEIRKALRSGEHSLSSVRELDAGGAPAVSTRGVSRRHHVRLPSPDFED